MNSICLIELYLFTLTFTNTTLLNTTYVGNELKPEDLDLILLIQNKFAWKYIPQPYPWSKL